MFFCFGWLGQHCGQQLKHTHKCTHTWSVMWYIKRKTDTSVLVCLFGLCVHRTFTPSEWACSPGTLRPCVFTPGECVGVVGTGTGELVRWALALLLCPLVDERPLVRLPVLPILPTLPPAGRHKLSCKKTSNNKNNLLNMSMFVHIFALTTLKKNMRNSKCTFRSSECVWVADK